jgi:CRP/FNR family transcriptional regulator, anaerobic regulatory protein
MNSLARFEPFASLGGEARALVARNVVITHSSRAAPVLHKGQAVSGAYLVIAGRLRVFTIAPDGGEATLYFIEPGEACVLALNCLFNNLLYPAWVQAEVPTEIALIPGPVYRQLFESERAIQNLTVQALSTLVYRLMAELELVHASTHRQRLVHFILSNADTDGALRITQQQLGRHLGTTREVIARLMQDLVRGGAVRSQRGAIAIRDLAALRRLGGVTFGTEARSVRR